MRWIGIDNYIALVTKDARFQSALVRTLLLVAAGVFTQTVIGYVIASLLSRVRRGRALLLSPILIPAVISPVVAGWQGRMIFNASYGPLNAILARFGIQGPAWLASSPDIFGLGLFKLIPGNGPLSCSGHPRGHRKSTPRIDRGGPPRWCPWLVHVSPDYVTP